MMGKTSILEKSLKCTAAVSTANVFAKFGADNDTCDVASSATDKSIGIVQHTTSAAGEITRLMLLGISDLKLGGTVTRSDELTSDANGKGVKAAAGQSTMAIALASGVSGDIIPVYVRPIGAI